MKKIFHTIIMHSLSLIIMLTASALLTGTKAQKICDKKESADDICPIKISGVQVFDRCFGNLNPLENKNNALGDAACDALRNANKLKKYFERSVQSQAGDLKDDLTAFIAVVSKDAINEEAIKKYRDANKLMKEVDEEIRDLLNDPKFGVKGRMKAIKLFFEQQGANLVAIGGIAGSFGEATGKVLPVVNEAGKIAGEISKISASVTNAGPEAKKQFDALKTAIENIAKDLQKLAALNGNDVIVSGTKLVAEVGPFAAECATCAGVISASVAAMGGGSGGTGTVVACPESAGITCIVAAAGAATTAAGVAIGSIASSTVCQQVVVDALKMGDYINSITKFVGAVTELAGNIQDNLERTEKAIEALNKLAVQLKEDNAASVKKIAGSLNNIADMLEDGFHILETKTLPAVNKLGTSMLKQLSTNTSDLVECFKRYSSTAGIVTTDVLTAAGDLAVAGATLIDASKVFDNIEKQGKQGLTAAERYIRNNRKELDDRANDLNKAVFGVNIGVVDLGKTVDRLKDIATGNNPVGYLSGKARAAADLVGDYTELVAKGLNEGKKAFLLDITISKRICKEKTDDALPKATSAKKKLEIAKAKRENSKVAQVQIPISEVVFRTSEIKPARKIIRAPKTN